MTRECEKAKARRRRIPGPIGIRGTDRRGVAYGTIQSRTGVDCSTTINAMRASRTRLHMSTLRQMLPSRPAMPTAAAAIARFCTTVIATGVPKPARASRSAPKQKSMMIAWIRWSG